MVAGNEEARCDRNCTLGEGNCAWDIRLRTAVRIVVDRKRMEAAGGA